MKKIINIVICILLLTLCMFGCEKNNNTTLDTQTENSETTYSVSETSNESPFLRETTSALTPTESDEGGGTVLPDKYRLCYYNVPYQFVLLVDGEEYEKWKEEVYIIQPNDTNQMIIKRFIQDFNISRVDFDKANRADATLISQDMKEVPIMNPQDYTNQEAWEVYNADIIYTFDDKIINEYYLSHPYPFLYESEYEDAVLSGTYRTQTTDFYFPELDSHSSFLLRGYEYPEDSTTVVTLSTTENLTEKTTEKEEATTAPVEVITE